MSPTAWARRAWAVRLQPGAWVAQRRLEVVPVETPQGLALRRRLAPPAHVELEERVDPPQPLAGEVVLGDGGLVEAAPGMTPAATSCRMFSSPPRAGSGVSK